MAVQCDISSNSSAHIAEDSETAPIWITISVILVGVVTILVNIPAIIAVIFTKVKNPNFRKTHLLSLGITDTLAGVSLFPILITFVYPNVKMSYWSCHVRILFFNLVYFNSMGQVCAICIDRICLLTKPSWRFTSHYECRLFRILGCMFLLILVLVSVIFCGLANPQTGEIVCKLETLFCNNFDNFSTFVGMCAMFFECAIITCCTSMIVVLQRHQRKRQQIAPNTRQDVHTVNSCIQGDRTHRNQNAQMLAETKSTVTITLIISIFVICVTPLNLGFTLQGLHLVEKTSRTTRHAMVTLSCLNSAINPFIYCFRIPEIATTLHSWFGNIRSLFRD